MENGLVSILTPCYNGEKFIYRLFDSILNQTYRPIEFIFVDDGSSDNTLAVAQEYESRFQRQGIRFISCRQANAGPAAALQLAVRLFQGQYLTWIDSDDFFLQQSIEKMVKYLQHHTGVPMVMGQAMLVSDPDLSPIKLLKREGGERIFRDLIYHKDINFCGYMVRAEAFLKWHLGREIVCKYANVGQNWSMLLPIAYQEKCGFLEEICVCFLERQGSHSRAKKSWEEIRTILACRQDTLRLIFDQIQMPDKDTWLEEYRIYLLKEEGRIARKYGDLETAEKNRMLLDSLLSQETNPAAKRPSPALDQKA